LWRSRAAFRTADPRGYCGEPLQDDAINRIDHQPQGPPSPISHIRQKNASVRAKLQNAKTSAAEPLDDVLGRELRRRLSPPEPPGSKELRPGGGRASDQTDAQKQRHGAGGHHKINAGNPETRAQTAHPNLLCGTTGPPK
jgi:hypothetical protein